MKVGDLVSYGEWFEENMSGPRPYGIIIDIREQLLQLCVMWGAAHKPVWELKNDIEVINESR